MLVEYVACHVSQKDAPGAVVVAVTSRAVFEGGDVGDDVSGVGVAFPLLQVRIKHAFKIRAAVVEMNSLCVRIVICLH